MDEKTLQLLEFDKVLDRLASFAAFSASEELAHRLRPYTHFEKVQERQAVTREARLLLSLNDHISLGGARDIRPLAATAARAGVLEAADLLEIKNTLIAARELTRSFENHKAACPLLGIYIARLVPPPGLVDAITRAISERGEVLDSASPRLAEVRREMKTAHERLLGKLEKLINDPHTAPMMQESLITQRNGRYVVPLKSDFKGQVRSIIHDQSASGATLFVEPLAVVEMNNRWQELQLAERDEERRILAGLSAQVGEATAGIYEMVDALADFDFALMCARYAEEQHAAEPVLHPTRPSGDKKHPGSTLRLIQARHPLLDPQTVVPIDVELDDETYIVIITGPNTGGKTVTLKTVGLLCVMAQCGLHIPAVSGSGVCIFHNIYADIGDEQSIEQSLSTFSGHISNIIRILKRVDEHKLVLLDELGAGTDPQEGAALARAIMDYLVEKPVTCLVATHYPELKSYAHTKPGVINASMEFNLKTLLPTYHLTLGLPGRSNALLIAERIGLMPEIIENARGTLDPEGLQVDKLLDEINHQRTLARRAYGEADRNRFETEKLRKELAHQMEELESQKLDILDQARLEAQARLENLESEMDEVRRALQRSRAPLADIKETAERVDAIKTELEKPVSRRKTDKTNARLSPKTLAVGQKVVVRSLKTEGLVTAINDEDIEVQIGSLRMRTRREDVRQAGEEDQPQADSSGAVEKSPPAGRKKPPAQPDKTILPRPAASSTLQLDLRGQRAEDALENLDRFLESAIMSGMPYVRIIHGKGTGKLRQVVREALSHSPHVSRWENALNNEGGEGATVAHLKE